ncbi:MAG: methionine--tRNA ligase [Candidatus Sungbacteria bacterium]|uniref:Methionine--tRNA ligase n=1 Tax=Candidatus Sungiibacteriota bacterium TaxID=2750080 RepID=A0A933DSX5_9BACT|nr:methionine--tRNA ligase [Candidatus Sungbacteria bacterium]
MSNAEKKFYITTAIPYVNAEPHIGHALEFVQADVIARYHRLKGGETLLLSGADENALKNVQAADAAGRDVQEFVDANAKLFADLAGKLGVQFDVFQKGSDRECHYPSSQELWRRCAAAGDIYKKSYTGLYCIGCEAFYTPDELTSEGECPEHPGRKLETVSEENYFFRLSRYRDRLGELIRSGELLIVPEARKNEALAFLERPLEDISISRTNERARNWGVPVPDDDSQRIYVWFDALNIYQSGIGFGWDEERYSKWWPADVHLIGKGILRFHAVYWPAFLLSAKLSIPKALFVHGYVTVNGQKISKTLGNTVDPFAIANRYGIDALRYYLLREIPSTGDGDFSEVKLVERYNGELANGLGNLVARVAALAEELSPLHFDFAGDIRPVVHAEIAERFRRYEEALTAFRLHEALAEIWRLIGFTDRYINEAKPWAIGDRGQRKQIVARAAWLVSTVANLLQPFLPATAERIFDQIAVHGGNVEIKRGAVLFPRLEQLQG